MREDLLWAARTVTEKVKTDQRSRALELLCVGVFGRRASLFPLIVPFARVAAPRPPLCAQTYEDELCVISYDDEDQEGEEETYWDDGGMFWLRESFARTYSGDDQEGMAALGKRGWERARLSFPYLELARRAWLNNTVGYTGPTSPTSTIGGLLFRITQAAPEDKVLNSLLYWLLDMVYKEMALGEQIPKWAPEPFLLRRPGVEARLMAELAQLGHLLQLLARSPAEEQPEQPLHGGELLRAVRETETTVTLLSTIRSAYEGRAEAPALVAKYKRLILCEELTLRQMQTLQYEALGELLGLDYDIVASRGASVREALAEWRNPELLFRYLDDNRGDAKMRELITRWLRSIFGLSGETLHTCA